MSYAGIASRFLERLCMFIAFYVEKYLQSLLIPGFRVGLFARVCVSWLITEFLVASTFLRLNNGGQGSQRG
jgi:hypothetical protein